MGEETTPVGEEVIGAEITPVGEEVIGAEITPVREEILPPREKAAFWIALILVVGFLFLIGVPYIYLFTHPVSGSIVAEVVDLIKTVAAVLSGVVGAVVGYYFRGGEQS